MAEESSEIKTTVGHSSPLGKQSPRNIIGTINVNNNDNNAISVATSVIGGAAIGSAGSAITSVAELQMAATGVGIVGSTLQSSSAAGGGGISVTSSSSASSLLTSGTSSTLITSTAISGSSTAAAAAAAAGGAGGAGGGIVVSSISVGGSSMTGNTSKNSGNSSPRSPKNSRKLRVRLNEQQLESSTREDLAAKWRDQDLYIECLEAQAAAQEGELACLRDSEDKYRQQCCEISHRERILVRRLASKEQQLLGYVNQITEMRASQTPTATALRSALLDPAVNILIQKLRQELQSTKAKLEDTQNELSAWKFTPDSNTGKRLMAKCRLLYQENEELGRMIASGRIAKLEGELVLQKSFSEEVKKSQSELDEFLQDLDEDVEGMQSTIYFLQQELRKARESVSLLQQENNSFKSVTTGGPPPQPPPQPPPPQPPPPPPPPQSSDPNNGLANGLPPVIQETLLPSVGKLPTDGNESETAGIACVSKREIDDDDDDDDHSVKIAAPGTTPTPSSQPVTSAIPITGTLIVTSDENPRCLSDEGKIVKCQPADDPDESSNDSAALIIKVDNEELTDREEDDEVIPKNLTISTIATSTTATIVDACEIPRGPQRQSMRTRDKTTMKNESVIIGKSNGDEKNSSRPASRRLLRDRTAKRDKSAAADSDDDRRLHKKKRRESILSIDYNETDDDSLILTNGEIIQSDTEDGP